MFQLWYYFKRRVPSSYKPVILITGCSSGIGLALTELLYRLPQYRVVATSRAESIQVLRDKFKEDDRFWIRPLDVTSDADRTTLTQEIERRWQGVNILINNAGVAYRAVLEHMTDEDEFQQTNINYLGPVSLIRLVMPYMRQTGRGKIINVSSVSGMLAMPTMASYSASKYALEGMSEALWYEARPLGINVTLIQPGFVRSQSFKRVRYTNKSRPDVQGDGVYSDYYQNMIPFIERLMKVSLTNPESIAKLILKVIRTENPPLWVAATWDALVFYYLRRWVPRRFLLPLLFMALPRARRWGERYSKKRT